jgi:hypothetical protein
MEILLPVRRTPAARSIPADRPRPHRDNRVSPFARPSHPGALRARAQRFTPSATRSSSIAARTPVSARPRVDPWRNRPARWRFCVDFHESSRQRHYRHRATASRRRVLAPAVRNLVDALTVSADPLAGQQRGCRAKWAALLGKTSTIRPGASPQPLRSCPLRSS